VQLIHLHFRISFSVTPSNFMDEQLVREMEHILNSNEDPELQGKSLARVLIYLLTLPIPNQSFLPLYKRFLMKSYEILPSSNLPDQFSKKLNIPIKRRRSVSFSDNPAFRRLANEKLLSPESEYQKKRESASLGMNNTDINRKFIPRKQLEQGFKANTKKLSINDSLLKNEFNPNVSEGRSRYEFNIPNLTVQEILKNPSLINQILNL
jgi:hypothetical protein